MSFGSCAVLLVFRQQSLLGIPVYLFLVAGVGGKLSRPVYLAPHPLGYQSKIILLSFLILNYLNVMIYHL